MTEYKKEAVDALLADKVAVLRNWFDRTEDEIFFCTSFRITEGAWNQLAIYAARVLVADQSLNVTNMLRRVRELHGKHMSTHMQDQIDELVSLIEVKP